MSDHTLDSHTLRQLLRRLDLSPRKGLAQNFLVESGYLRKAVSAAEVGRADTVLEIGAGPGTLTAQLAVAAGRVIAVELDDRFIPHLRSTFVGQPNVIIIHADIMRTDIVTLLRDVTDTQNPIYKVVANLPYYITSALLRRLLEAIPPPTVAVLMLQWEVAQRIVARPPRMSLLAVSVQFYGRPRLVTKVPAKAFYPIPKVDSALLRVDSVTPDAWPYPQPAQFFRVVRAGFSQRRKQLQNNLSRELSLPKTAVVSLLQSAQIAPQRRAETLTVEEWARLTALLDRQSIL